MTEPALLHQPPLTDHVNAYDEKHLAVYLQLLMAEEEGADWREVVSVVFGIDPQRESERAQAIYDSHLARARWMTEAGYRALLKPQAK